MAVSGLLGLLAFLGVLVLAPVDAPGTDQPRVTPGVPPLQTSIQRVRSALIEGRALASRNLASSAVEHHPGHPDGWMWLGITEMKFGDPNLARDAGTRMLELVQRYEQSARRPSNATYRLGWAHFLRGDLGESRSAFARAAEQYAAENGSGRDRWVSYNLACYLAMSGQHSQAADLFVEAVDLGYGQDSGWWRVDPDLDPIREEPAYRLAARQLEQREAAWEAQRAAEEAARLEALTETDPMDHTEAEIQSELGTPNEPAGQPGTPGTAPSG